MGFHIGTHIPQFRYQQSELDEIILRNVKDKNTYMKMSSNSGISYRNMSFNIHEEWNNVASMTLDQRLNESYKKGCEYALEASKKALDGYLLEDIDEVICGSSTCLHAPSLDSYIAMKLGLRKDVMLTNISMKGCASGGIALNIANDKAKLGKKCLVVLVDVHSYHIPSNKTSDTIGRLIELLLFSDGASAIVIDKPLGISHTVSNFNYYSNMQIGFEEDHVFGVLDKNVHKIMTELYKSLGLKSFQNYIVHPGGRSILDEMERNIPNGNFTDSYNTLRYHGNMSAATVLFVLDEAQKHDRLKDSIIITFGQGVTCSCMEVL